VVAQIVKMLATVYGGQGPNRAPQHSTAQHSTAQHTSRHCPQLDKSSPHLTPIPYSSYAGVLQVLCSFQRHENTLNVFRNCATMGRVL
jgi:hypothetical protein